MPQGKDAQQQQQKDINIANIEEKYIALAH